MHKCAKDDIHCFDCGVVICRECMSVTNDALRCKACDKKTTRKVQQIVVRPNPVQLGAATTFFSFVIIKFMNFIGIYLPGLLQMSIVAALLGVGLAALVVKTIDHKPPKAALLIVIAGIAVGTALNALFDQRVPSTEQLMLIALVILTVAIRMRLARI